MYLQRIFAVGPALDSYGGPQAPVYDSYGGPINRVDPRTPNTPSNNYAAGIFFKQCILINCK
jgi:hypothetical protein